MHMPDLEGRIAQRSVDAVIDKAVRFYSSQTATQTYVARCLEQGAPFR